jgi:hypothetical protein
MRKASGAGKSGGRNPEGRDKAREGIKKAAGAAKEKVEKLRKARAARTDERRRASERSTEKGKAAGKLTAGKTPTGKTGGNVGPEGKGPNYTYRNQEDKGAKGGQTRTPRSSERRAPQGKPSPRPVNNTLTEQAMNFGAGPQAQAPGMPQGNPGMMGRPGMGQMNPAMRGQRNVDLAGLRALQARMQGRQLGMY